MLLVIEALSMIWGTAARVGHDRDRHGGHGAGGERAQVGRDLAVCDHRRHAGNRSWSPVTFDVMLSGSCVGHDHVGRRRGPAFVAVSVYVSGSPTLTGLRALLIE